MLELPIHGGKGGEEKAHQPVETPNNLLSVAYAKVLIAVAEGELAGKPTDADIFLDGTPLVNPDGSSNFGGVKWEWRSGTTDQEYIKGLPEVSTEYNIGFELRQGFPWVRNVTKTQLDAVRVTFQWPALLEQKQNGDTVGVGMDYMIEISTDDGAFVEYERYHIYGKTNTSYERTHRVDLPKAERGWIIRATKLTPDNQSGNIQDTINVKSYAEVVDVKQRYPNTALLYVEFDSRMFGGGAIPKISVRTHGRIIRVPENYDPETRTYSGVWNGSFKWAWSDNPAWVFHDIMTQDRFGLGNKVNLNMIDKWSLYEVAQYCDVMVGDGKGGTGMQPRHTCNIYIQEKQSAWQVLRDIASIFNGMTYWNGNQFTAIADKQEPLDNIPIFSRSNVMNGRFDYAAADDKSIYTSALVSYDEPDNHYNTEVESTFETSQIIRWGGDRQTSLSAIGCTSRGEAQRRGKYTLITNMYNRTVSFRTGLQGLNDEMLPGKLFHVVDPLIGGRPFTGRLKAAVGSVVTLDRNIDGKSGDILYITRGNGITEGRTILSVSGNVVTLQTPYTEEPKPNAVWYLEMSDLKSQVFRVTKVTSPEESVYEIEGVEYNDSKYAAVDNGARLEERPISVVPPSIQQPPTNVNITSNTYVDQTMAVTTMTLSWDQTPNAVGYEAQWRVGQGDWVNLGVTGAPEFNVKGIYAGSYVARVRAINAFGIKSIWSSSQVTQLNGKEGTPPSITSLVTSPMFFGIRLDWYFPEGAEDTLYTEIMYSEDTSFLNASKLGDFAYPIQSHELHGLTAGKRFWFWARLVDRTGNIGPWFPNENSVGIEGHSEINDQGKYNDYFAGLISNTALDKQLYDRIELIDGNGPGSVNQRLESAVSDLEDQIQNITDALVYDPDKAYQTGDIVRLGQKLYQAQGPVPAGVAPPDPIWKDVGTILEDANNLASRVDVVEVKVEDLDGKLTSTATSLESLQAAYRDDDGVGSQNDAIAGWDSRAQIITERTVRANADEAIARELVVFKASIDNNTAAISQETSVRANADSALSQRVDTVQATAGSNTASIQTLTTAQATTDGKINTSWTLKMEQQQDGKYVAAGIGLGIENGPAGLQSQFLVRADRFAVVAGSGSTSLAPFVVENGQVFISKALIGDGWITNAMIGNVIQSNDFVDQTTGWQINKSGTIQINGSVAGSGRMRITNTGILLIDPNNVVRIRISL